MCSYITLVLINDLFLDRITSSLGLLPLQFISVFKNKSVNKENKLDRVDH